MTFEDSMLKEAPTFPRIMEIETVEFEEPLDNFL